MCARVWIPTHSFVGPDARPDRGHVTRATGGFEELPEGKVCHMSGQRFGVEQKERVATGSHPSPPALEIKACVCVCVGGDGGWEGYQSEEEESSGVVQRRQKE